MGQLKKRSTYLGVLVALVGGMAFAPAASAHKLSKAGALYVAKAVARDKARDANTPYINREANVANGVSGWLAVCDDRTKSNPGVEHRLGCWLYYQTPESAANAEWACRERIQVYYAPHNDGDPPPNHEARWTNRHPNGNYFTHPC